MKKVLIIACCMLFGAYTFAQELPDTEIKDVNSGNKVAFNQIFTPGKVTLVSFWATWCIPCKKEIKNVSLKIKDWKKEVNFDYITISIDESRAESMVRTYAISQGWDFPYYLDANSDLKRSLSFQNVPFTLIVDKTGKIAFVHTGYEEGGEFEIWEKIKELAAK